MVILLVINLMIFISMEIQMHISNLIIAMMPLLRQELQTIQQLILGKFQIIFLMIK